jgi:PqqD family protein of HPr-rel-A system
MKWQIDSMGRFYDPDEGMVVYFDPASGDTHLISDFAAYLIQQFTDQPMGIEALIKQISPDIDPGDLLELTQATPNVLEELVTLDILKIV